MTEMELLLALWLEDQHQRHIPVSLILIQEKSKGMFEKGEGSGSEESVASTGWLMHFKAYANVHKGEAASGDDKAASEFPNRLAELKWRILCWTSV